MAADINEKVERYERLLKEALEKADIAPIQGSHMRSVAEDFENMARSYYEDGTYFVESGDPVNAWLDAGAKLGVFDVDDEILFTI